MTKTYRASEQLVEVFIRNGFNEITASRYPEHARQIQQNGYNPHAQKRAFIVGNRKQNVLTLDYINIIPYHHGASSEGTLSLTEEELKSIVAFYKLPAAAQLAFKRSNGKITELYARYKRICENPSSYYRRSDRQIKVVYESVAL